MLPTSEAVSKRQSGLTVCGGRGRCLQVEKCDESAPHHIGQHVKHARRHQLRVRLRSRLVRGKAAATAAQAWLPSIPVLLAGPAGRATLRCAFALRQGRLALSLLRGALPGDALAALFLHLSKE